MSDTFTCERCKRTFPRTRNEEESDRDWQELWGDDPKDDCIFLCDDCFEQFLALWAAQSKDQTQTE